MSDTPKVFGDQDITIAIGPTGLVKVWAGQTQISLLERIEIRTEEGLTKAEFGFVQLTPADTVVDELISANINKLKDFLQVSVKVVSV